MVLRTNLVSCQVFFFFLGVLAVTKVTNSQGQVLSPYFLCSAGLSVFSIITAKPKQETQRVHALPIKPLQS